MVALELENFKMSNIRVNITDLKQVLDIIPAEHNIMLVGNHGIGKSEILTEHFSKKGMPVVALFLGQMSDPGDLLGLPHKNEATGKTDFMPPYWFPVDGKPIVLFLDELNRARPEILQTIMDLALNRKLAGRKLPEGSRIIAAVNEGDQYQLTDLDPALVSRFNILTFSPTVQEWLLWADKVGVDKRVIDFIRENGIWLDKTPDAKEGADTGLEKTPDRRAWKRVSDIIKGHDDLGGAFPKTISSVVGAMAASKFLASASSSKILSGKDILYNFEKHIAILNNYQLHDLTVLNDAIYRHLEVEKVADKNINKVSGNLESYFDWLSKDRKEAAAHFANIYITMTYPEAVSFIAKNCMSLIKSLINYVKGIC